MGVLDRLILRDDQWERMSMHIIGDQRTRGSSGRDNRMFVEVSTPLEFSPKVPK